jgi:hypothetical protein
MFAHVYQLLVDELSLHHPSLLAYFRSCNVWQRTNEFAG